MKLTLGWKTALLGLLGLGILFYVFSGPGGGYQPPRVAERESEPVADFTRAKFTQVLKSMEGGRLVAKVEKGLSDHELRLQVDGAWSALDQATRYRFARAMWQAWAALHDPGDRYKARILIIDEKGMKIGGSRLLDPSKIWVRKP
ncbi:MAG: hypothetical protein R3229_02820 [Alphaproteobacteria bacterium]|nr:hypothetical protein [Alphaproteobacteria bacterium]